MSKSTTARPANGTVARELNALIQNYLYEKFGQGAMFQVQYNPDNIHIWVQANLTNYLETQDE